MTDSLLTDKQKFVLMRRKEGLTQNEIAQQLNTTRSNITLIEKSAKSNIALAKQALEFLHSLDATLVCTLASGSNINNEIFVIFKAAASLSIKVQFKTGALLNFVQTSVPEKLNGDIIAEDINVYLNNTGVIYVY